MKLQVRVKPGSREEKAERQPDGSWIVKVRAVPEGGRANEAVAAVLAEALGVSKSAVRVLTPKSRMKIVEVRKGL